MSISVMLKFGIEIFISFWDISKNVESYIFKRRQAFSTKVQEYTSAKPVCNDKKYQNGSNYVFFSDCTHGKLEKMLELSVWFRGGMVPIENNVKLPV